uniref:Uncharacterized protein n=1 Tax=Pipistrellus kuhlii TaxID=59472 RepID=A0A7J7XW26_PIPKU|nr:hypothetical protein mPipKuh1_010490 [Pipistrellus kuhlii]
MDRALACGLKGPRFNYHKGHKPGLQEGVCRRHPINESLPSLMFLSLSPFLSEVYILCVFFSSSVFYFTRGGKKNKGKIVKVYMLWSLVTHDWLVTIELSNADIEHFYNHRKFYWTALVRLYHECDFFFFPTLHY